jgi:hypothetical protein
LAQDRARSGAGSDRRRWLAGRHAAHRDWRRGDLPKLFKPEALVAPLDKEGKVTGENMGRVSGRLTYLLTLGLVMGGLGAITQYLATGKKPDEIKDYFFPKTGRRNADDSEERLQYPSYWMDHYKLATSPLQTGLHKLHPSISMLTEALSNQDYYGTQIRDPKAAWHKQAEQIGEYLAKGFLPYSISNQSKLAETDAGAGSRVGNFFGITQAPRSVSRSEFQTFVAKGGDRGWDKHVKTQDEKAHTDEMHDVEDALRRGETPDFGDLSAKDQKNARKAAGSKVPGIEFKYMQDIADKVKAYDLATPEERERYGLRAMILKAHPQTSSIFQRKPADEKAAILRRIKEIADEAPTIGANTDEE